MPRNKRSPSTSSKHKRKAKSHGRNSSIDSTGSVSRESTLTPPPRGPSPSSKLQPSHIVDHDSRTGRYRIRFADALAEQDAWLLREKIEAALLKKWEDAGEKSSRKRVSFSEVVLRKRINAAGNAIVGEEKLRGCEDDDMVTLEVIEGVAVGKDDGEEAEGGKKARSSSSSSSGGGKSSSKAKR